MANSIETFPFPFTKDQYEYTNNSSQLNPVRCVEVTGDYNSEIQLKRKLIEEHPERCYRSFRHSIEGQWEILKLLFHEIATYEPDHFTFERRGKEYRFQNLILGEEERFIDRDLSSIDSEPFDLAGRHVQEDLILMGDREGTLFLDAGQLCFPSNWSLAFAFGLDFKSIHTPVPRINQTGFIEKVERFIKRIRPGTAWERNNWSVTITNKLDTPLETYSEWGRSRLKVTEENVEDLLHLRVEIQRLYRLPLTNDVLFTIHTYLLSLKDMATNNEWLTRFFKNVETLTDDIAEYKGISLYKKPLMNYFEQKVKKD
ncbi:DUF3445 domain-containing protein [Alkalihalobacillus sp. AL-G]|uniref:heme-dependent oxidative N-demethylase family protein n=1 Tax=Alkalihalobacillus sp. AL-G TaxID=2926399 RepID=UPI00272B6C77|nr:DUF3445 domain-containing protein [Alkalihalobacillus sp. AL-G]WLD94864.1 DUF3445 domain-containing protein [Alkalihalobacillus sp. AL-G]